jgi:hypothetical protein
MKQENVNRNGMLPVATEAFSLECDIKHATIAEKHSGGVPPMERISENSESPSGRELSQDGSKRSRSVRRLAFVGAAVAAFLSLSSCDRTPPRPYQYGKAGEQQEKKDEERADRMWRGGSSGAGGRTNFFGVSSGIPGSGVAADSPTGTVRGGFGSSGTAHSSGA